MKTLKLLGLGCFKDYFFRDLPVAQVKMSWYLLIFCNGLMAMVMDHNLTGSWFMSLNSLRLLMFNSIRD